ncbi:MAG: hypothetical protein ACKPKO_47270, partial [Candidatus Fonsibacter sp.]
MKQEVKHARGGYAFSIVKRERAGSEAHTRAQRQEKQSRRNIAVHSVWVSIHVAGRLVTQKDREKYWADMADPRKQE